MEKEKKKKILVGMRRQIYQQIVKRQYDIFKKENKRVSIASLINDALEQVHGTKRGG